MRSFAAATGSQPNRSFPLREESEKSCCRSQTGALTDAIQAMGFTLLRRSLRASRSRICPPALLRSGSACVRLTLAIPPRQSTSGRPYVFDARELLVHYHHFHGQPV